MPFQKPLTAKEIAGITGGELTGNPNATVKDLNRLGFAKPGDLTFYSDVKYKHQLGGTKASAILAGTDFDESLVSCEAVIKLDNPYKAFSELIMMIDSQKPRKKSFIHPSAVIESGSDISDSAYIGANVSIGENCRIAGNCIIMPGAVLYDNVTIGEGTEIHSNCVICSETVIGKNCVINPGAVIGADGFGFLENPDKSFKKIPQIGNVIIEDDVEIGANTTIDCALVGSTIIAKGVKIDNLIMIAHNCIIGEHTAMAGQAGVAGSTVIGKRNRLGAQTGIAGHAHTADDVILMAQSGTAKSLNKPGAYFGSPAKKSMDAFKEIAAMKNLPALLRDFKKMKKIIEEKLGTEL